MKIFGQKYNRFEVFSALLFLLPTMVLIIGFCYYPAYKAITGSFYSWDGFNDPIFVGLANYKTLFADAIFHKSLVNVFLWSMGSTAVVLIAPFVGAELIFHLFSKRAQYLYRVLFVIPMVVPAIVVIQIWTFVYEPSLGILNQLMTAMGLEHLIQNWLGDGRWVIPSLIFMGFPWVSGLNLLIYYSGLQSIPTDVIEFSQLDGCTGLRRIFYIDIPLIMGQVKLLLVLAIINTLQNVTVPLLMTGGGPGYDSYVPSLYMYFKAFKLSDFGMSYTIATVMFVIIFALTVVSKRIQTKNV